MGLLNEQHAAEIVAGAAAKIYVDVGMPSASTKASAAVRVATRFARAGGAGEVVVAPWPGGASLTLSGVAPSSAAIPPGARRSAMAGSARTAS